jgi:hypothetical protein
MNKSFSILVCTLVVAISFSVASAQKPPSKDELFKEIATLSNTKKPEDMEKAFQMSRDFLTRFGKDKDDRVGKIRVFYTNYRQSAFYTAIDGKKYTEAFAIGKEMLAEQPDNIDVLMNLSYAGYNASMGTKDRVFVDDAVTFARKTTQLFEAGAMPKEFFPFKDKDTATAFMHYIAGVLSYEKDMSSAVIDIYRATLSNSVIKDSSDPYSMIASYYEAQYENATKGLNEKIAAKTITDADQKVEKAKVDKIVDLMMDAYARTVARAEAEKNPNLGIWKLRLVQIYKFKNRTEEGLVEFIKYVNTMPMTGPAKF